MAPPGNQAVNGENKPQPKYRKKPVYLTQSMILFLLAILLVVLNILDVTTTRKALRHGAYEANPIAGLLMRLHLFIPAKIVVVIAVLFLMAVADENTGITLGIIVCVIYVIIVGNNLRTIRLLSQD